MTIVVTDLEGTLTTGSSWKGLRSYYKRQYSAWRYNRFFLRWLPRYLLVLAGLLDRRAAMFGWMRDEVRLFCGMSTAEFDRMVTWVVEQVMWPGRRIDVLAELDKKQQDGVEITVVSSAYQPIVDAFASRMKAEAIGSQLIIQGDRINGIMDPINAYEHKTAYIRQAFGDTPIASAYGDTLSDLPMLEMSHDPVAVYPDDELRLEAIKRGWRIFEGED